MAGVGWRGRRAQALLVGLRWLLARVSRSCAEVEKGSRCFCLGFWLVWQQQYSGVLVVNMASSTPIAMPAFML